MNWKFMSRKQHLHINVYSSFIQKYQTLEITTLSFNKSMYTKQTILHLDNEMLFRNKKKWVIKPQKEVEKP
jgi:hypothetical protein